ncbi:hypothetical protein R1flu_000674 [Riccia fluitans]|uniref:U6 snRNA phosphodiesterase n=1 Tax=Riccia fluitans TaxID=41844 RepID=A0ABD1Y219_9MARC
MIAVLEGYQEETRKLQSLVAGLPLRGVTAEVRRPPIVLFSWNSVNVISFKLWQLSDFWSYSRHKMDALKMYRDPDSDDEEEDSCSINLLPEQPLKKSRTGAHSTIILPSPPDDLLRIPSSVQEIYGDAYGGRTRSFPHVEGNFALHVYIPVTIPSYARSRVLPLLEKAFKRFPKLCSVEDGSANASPNCALASKLKEEYHISLSRTVPVRVHQIESIVSMLRRRLLSQNRYFVEFGSWEVFTNDEKTRTFLSLEIVAAGVLEMKKQVSATDDVFKLHNLPTFYENPRPHISLGWALGDISSSLKVLADELNCQNQKTLLWSSQVKKVECKAGQRVYIVWE